MAAFRISLPLALLVLLALPQPCGAQLEEGAYYVGPVGGASFPGGNYGELAGPGWALGLCAEYVVRGDLSVGLDAMYNVHSSGTVELPDYDLSVLQLALHGRWFPLRETRANPYLLLGAGMYVDTVDLGDEWGEAEPAGMLGWWDESRNHMGVQFGVGFQLPAQAWLNGSLQATFHLMLDDDTIDEVDYGPSRYLTLGTTFLFGPF